MVNVKPKRYQYATANDQTFVPLKKAPKCTSA